MRRSYLLLALLLFVLALAASASAVPTLVELKFSDPVGVLGGTTPTGDDVLSALGNGGGKGSSKEKGNSGKSGKADLKSLTLWLSTDGRTWTSVSSDVLDLSSDQITARLGSGGTSTDPLGAFGLGGADITGGTSQTYYVGLSTSSTSFDSGSFSARLVSWQYVNARHVTSSVPEPAVWPLFATGLAALGAFLGSRKKR